MVSSRYGWRCDPFTGRRAWHRGLDLAAPHGSPVCAWCPGVVLDVTARGAGGLAVTVGSSSGWIVTYCHLSRADVQPGARLARGATLGTVGSTGRSTGPHVHVTTRYRGRVVDPEALIARIIHGKA
jgi:murein DD-endopeptidase MepM/ murein hydrolase activator NlpD